MTKWICSESWALKYWEKWIIFNSDEIETDMQNSESRRTDDKKLVFHEESHYLLYSLTSLWEDY